MRSISPTFPLVVAAALLSGCGDPAGPAGEDLLRISIDSAVITAGDSVKFQAGWGWGVRWSVPWFHRLQQPRHSGGYLEMVGRRGWIRGLRAGYGILIASLGQLADTVHIRVVPGPATTAALDGIAPRLWTRHPYTLPALARDRVGNRTEGELVWRSETPERITFTEDGTALPLDSGTATFTVGLAGRDPSDRDSVLIVPFSGEWREFGLQTLCALDTGGRVSCSGYDGSATHGWETPLDVIGSGGQYQERRGAPFGYPVDTDVLFRSVQSGPNHVCALGEDGLAYCWGWSLRIGNQEGLVTCNSFGGTRCRLEPRPVSPDVVFLDITSSCGVTPTGDVWCWNETPELVFSDTPLRTLDGKCGLSEEGAAYCWGSNSRGQLGTGAVDTLPHPDPVPVDTELRFTELSRSQDHACGLTAEGEVWCWGSGAFGQLGTEAPLEDCPPEEPGGDPLPCAPSPVRVTSVAPFTAVEAGWRYSCGLAGAGTVYCWGVNDFGQVSPDAAAPDTCMGEPCSRLPQTVPLDDAATSVTAGIYDTCVGRADGSFRCFGAGDHRFDPIEGFASP